MCDTKLCCVTIYNSDISYHTNSNPKSENKKINEMKIE